MSSSIAAGSPIGCRPCGPAFRVHPPREGLSRHFTQESEAFALLLLRGRPMGPVAERVGETDTRLWRMLFRQVDATYAHNDLSYVSRVGVDELSVRKGHGLGRKPAGRYRGWTGVSPSFASLR